MTTVEQLEDRVVALEETSRDIWVELRNHTYRLDRIEQRLQTIETGMERIEAVQAEHTSLLQQILERLP